MVTKLADRIEAQARTTFVQPKLDLKRVQGLKKENKVVLERNKRLRTIKLTNIGN